MSYCRFSCLDGYSEAYVYASFEGWVTHIADSRQKAGAPTQSNLLLLSAAGRDDHPAAALYREQQKIAEAWRAKNPHQPIDHPEAGASFHHENPGECADNLERLAKEGFIIPFLAIQSLREDQKDFENQPEEAD